MVVILCDTCVWLNLAKDPQEKVILDKLAELVTKKKAILLVPEIVITEFQRNKDDIVATLAKRNQNLLKVARELVKAFGDEGKTDEATAQLIAVKNKMPALGVSMAKAYVLIEKLFNDPSTVKVGLSESVKSVVVDLALRKAAPFHRNKNSLADAVIIETFREHVASTRGDDKHFLFVTANKDDFSEPNGDANNPHPDFSSLFSSSDVSFFINAGKAVNFVEENLVPPEAIDHLERIRSMLPPKCHFCGGRSLMPCGATGRDWTGETIYYLICRDCSQWTDVREAWEEV